MHPSKLLLLPVALLALSCGRGHEQLRGDYRFTATEVITDDCALLADPESLWDGSFESYGDVVRMNYGLLDLILVGSYLEGVERFSMDGSAANTTTTVGSGEECLLDRISLHLEGTTVDQETFEGTLRVRYEADRPDTCVCQLLTRYRAVHQSPTP